jgi:hypothetical protein
VLVEAVKPIACGKNNAYQLHRMRMGEVVGIHQLSKTGIDRQQKCSDSTPYLLVNDLHVAGA